MSDDQPTRRPGARGSGAPRRAPRAQPPRLGAHLAAPEATLVTDALTRLAMQLPKSEGVLAFAHAFCVAVGELSPGTRVGVRLYDGTRPIEMHAGASTHDLARHDLPRQDQRDTDGEQPIFGAALTTIVVPVRTPEVLSLHLAAAAPISRRRLRLLAERVTPVLVAGVAAELASQRTLEALRAREECAGRALAAERKIAVAEIAARIVHDVQQPFTAITNYAAHLARALERAGSDPRDLRRLDALVESIERARELSGLLLSHALPVHEPPELLSLDAIVEDAARFSEDEAARAGIRIDIVKHRDVPSVLGRPSELTRVLLNVLKNACDAIASSAPMGGGRVDIAVARNGSGGATVSIRDNGVGIERHALPRIFEPFYSSKTPREGTGLGLAIAREIVSGHGGAIVVDAELGKGARFDIVLPPPERSPLRGDAE